MGYSIGRVCDESEDKTIVIKSTVPIFGDKILLKAIKAGISENRVLRQREINLPSHPPPSPAFNIKIVSIPEFLAEGI